MRKARILVVDDEVKICESYKLILSPKEKRDLGLATKAAALFEESAASAVCPEIEEFSYVVDSVCQGADALDCVQKALEEGDPYALIFLDMRMPPGIDGLETAKKIRASDPFVEIVVMTAFSDYNYSQLVASTGGAERLMYFHKPFHKDQVLQLAQSLAARWSVGQKERSEAEQEKGKRAAFQGYISDRLPAHILAPLNVIRGDTQVLFSHFDMLSHDEVRHLLQNVNASSEKLFSSINKLFLFAQIERKALDDDFVQSLSERSFSDVARFICGIAREKAYAADRVNDFRFDVKEACVAIDEHYLGIALAEMIENALKYSPKGTQIDIHGKENGSFYEITVADRGPSLGQEEIDYLLEDRSFDEHIYQKHGSALGVRIVQAIAKLHGGQCTMSAKNGLEVTLSVPLCK